MDFLLHWISSSSLFGPVIRICCFVTSYSYNALPVCFMNAGQVSDRVRGSAWWQVKNFSYPVASSFSSLQISSMASILPSWGIYPSVSLLILLFAILFIFLWRGCIFFLVLVLDSCSRYLSLCFANNHFRRLLCRFPTHQFFQERFGRTTFVNYHRKNLDLLFYQCRAP